MAVVREWVSTYAGRDQVAMAAAGNAVVVPFRCHGIGKDSGARVEMDVIHVLYSSTALVSR